MKILHLTSELLEMKYYILFGPPGAGKGTQAKLMVEKFDLYHVSTGDLLRKEIAKGTELGKLAKSLIDDGNFVDDYIVEQMIENVMDENPQVKGFIFDGFPRTVAQAKHLDVMLAKRNSEVTKVLSIIISDDLVYKRIRYRANIEGRKDDTSDEIIQNRIDTYHKKTEPLIGYYNRQGKYYEIDGDGGVDDILQKISREIAL